MTAFRKTKKDEPVPLGWFAKRKLRIKRYFSVRREALVTAVQVGYKVWRNMTTDMPKLTLEHLAKCPPYDVRDSIEGSAVIRFHRELEFKMAREREKMASAGLNYDSLRLCIEPRLIAPEDIQTPLKESDVYDGIASDKDIGEVKVMKEKV